MSSREASSLIASSARIYEFSQPGGVGISLGVLGWRDNDRLRLSYNCDGLTEYWPISDSIEDESILPFVVQPSDEPLPSDPWFQTRDIRVDEQHLVCFAEVEVSGPSLREGYLPAGIQLRKSRTTMLLDRY